MSHWCNGRLGEASALSVHDRGFLLGDGLFETILWRDGVLVLIDAHLNRLRASADQLGIDVRYSDEELKAACRQVASAHQTASQEAIHSLAVRLTLSRGPTGRGIAIPDGGDSTHAITASAFAPADRPLRLQTSVIRRNETSPLSRLKSLNYLDNILARTAAGRSGFDDALILNTRGNVACTSVANIWIVEDGKVVTPPVEDGVLPGIVRGHLLSLLSDAGLSVGQESIALSRLLSADACFCTNSLQGVVPVGFVDDQKFDTQAVAPIRRVYEDWMSSVVK